MQFATTATRRATPERGTLRPVVYSSEAAGELLAPILRSTPYRVTCNLREGHLPAADLGHGQVGRERRLLAIPAAVIDRAARVGAAGLHRPPGLAEIQEGLADYPILMSPSEVGQALSIRRQTVWDLSRVGHLPTAWMGSGYMTGRGALAAWLHGIIRDSMTAWAESRRAV